MSKKHNAPYLSDKYDNASPAQVRQRELSWLLYITTGLEANVAHARVANFTTIPEEDDSVLMELDDALNTAIESLRTLLKEIPR